MKKNKHISSNSEVRLPNIEKLVAFVRDSKNSDFYRDAWVGAGNFSELPAIFRADFLRVPLSKRRYKNDKALVKIIHSDGEMFLSEWSFEDIGKEKFGLSSNRPMVYLTNSHEAMEKSMWCYENNMVPLVGEKDPNVAMFAAGKYKIDSLIADAESLPKLMPYLEKLGKKLLSISILGDHFNTLSLTSYLNFAEKVRLVLCLPEVGSFAELYLNYDSKFKALPDVILEDMNGFLSVTKNKKLVTPIVRYKTDILADVASVY